MSISERLAAIRGRIDEAAVRAGRDPKSVRLVGVSKKKPASLLREAYEAGLRDFGENYVQELVQKGEELADLPDLRFHLIGHLQRNKARHAVVHASVVQSVDSLELVAELGRRAAASPVPAPRAWPRTDGGRHAILVEVNLAEELQKGGCAPRDLGVLLSAIEGTPALHLQGLMAIPPVTDSLGEARRYFDALRRLRDEHGGPERLPELSMGMSADFEEAILAGATLVRVGTALFGDRVA